MMEFQVKFCHHSGLRLWRTGMLFSTKSKGHKQGMSCEGACAHTHVRCAVTRVRAKSILKSVRDVRACGLFSSARCAITLLHTIWNKMDRK
jgi:hypothetical protein